MRRHFYFLWILFIIAALAARVFFYFHFHKETTLPRNQQIKFEATVKAEPKISDLGQTISIADAKIYAASYPRFSAGDRIKVSGKVDDRGRIFGAEVEKINGGAGVANYVAGLRQKISERIFAMLPQDEATLIVGAVLGVDQINESFHNKLVNTGTIHVVVVSGENLSIVAAVLMGLAKVLGRRRSLVLATLAVFAYAALTGFNPPVARAVLMVFATTIATFFGREIRPVWGLFLAAAVIVFISPSALAEISFQLTFAATLGIVTLGNTIAGPVSRFLPTSARSKQKSVVNQKENLELRAVGNPSTTATRKLCGQIIKALAVPISAYLFTAPIILYYFGQVSAISPLVNVFVLEAVAPIMMLGFLIAFSSLVFLPAAQVLAYFAFVPALYFVKVVDFFAGLPVPLIALGKGSLVFVAAFYFMVLGLVLLLGKARLRPGL
jgi:competence protein ComEC